MPLPPDPLTWAIKAFRDDRTAGYSKYRRYINGDQPLEFATQKFRSAFGRMFQEFGYNRCATIVDAHADRLRVAGFASALATTNEETGEVTDPIGQAAMDLWDDNMMDIHEGEIETEALGLGDGYVIAEMNPVTGRVQLWPQDADQIRVMYADDQPGKIILAAKAWKDDDRTRVNLYFEDRIEKYRSTNRTPSGMPTHAGAFEPFHPEGDTAWPMPLAITDTVPVFHVANNARINQYGVSELRDVLPLQDGLNKTLMDMLVTMEFAAFPQRVLINVDTDDPETVEDIQKFQAAVNRLLTLTGSSDGKQPSIAEFTAANVAQYLDVAESWDIRISRVTKVPPSYLNISGPQESGIAKRMDVEPFTTKIEDRQRAYGAVYAAFIEYGLRLQGIALEPGTIRVNWTPAAPMSKQDSWEIAELQSRTGLPFGQMIREMGYEPKQIQAIMDEKEAERERAVADFMPLEVA